MTPTDKPTLSEEDMESRDHAPSVRAVTSGQSHTPGPWHIGARGGPGQFVIQGQLIKVGGRHRRIATVGSYRAGPHELESETRANARLIAAAPDLLDALINVLNDLAPIDYDDEILEPGNGAAVSAYWMRPTVLAARAVISKAEGRS